MRVCVQETRALDGGVVFHFFYVIKLPPHKHQN